MQTTTVLSNRALVIMDHANHVLNIIECPDDPEQYIDVHYLRENISYMIADNLLVQLPKEMQAVAWTVNPADFFAYDTTDLSENEMQDLCVQVSDVMNNNECVSECYYLCVDEVARERGLRKYPSTIDEIAGKDIYRIYTENGEKMVEIVGFFNNKGLNRFNKQRTYSYTRCERAEFKLNDLIFCDDIGELIDSTLETCREYEGDDMDGMEARFHYAKMFKDECEPRPLPFDEITGIDTVDGLYINYSQKH